MQTVGLYLGEARMLMYMSIPQMLVSQGRRYVDDLIAWKEDSHSGCK